MMKRVTAKLATMRKPQEFSIAAMSDGNVMVQSDRSIGTFDPATGNGRLSIKGSTFVHLSYYGFAYTFPVEFVAEVLAALPTPGGEN